MSLITPTIYNKIWKANLTLYMFAYECDACFAWTQSICEARKHNIHALHKKVRIDCNVYCNGSNKRKYFFLCIAYGNEPMIHLVSFFCVLSLQMLNLFSLKVFLIANVHVVWLVRAKTSFSSSVMWLARRIPRFFTQNSSKTLGELILLAFIVDIVFYSVVKSILKS